MRPTLHLINDIAFELLKRSCVLIDIFFEENCIAEIGEGDSKDSLARDDDAHKAFVST